MLSSAATAITRIFVFIRRICSSHDMRRVVRLLLWKDGDGEHGPERTGNVSDGLWRRRRKHLLGKRNGHGIRSNRAACPMRVRRNARSAAYACASHTAVGARARRLPRRDRRAYRVGVPPMDAVGSGHASGRLNGTPASRRLITSAFLLLPSGVCRRGSPGQRKSLPTP